MVSVNAWPQEKTARMIALYDADPTRETIAEIAEEFGIGAPTVRARLNTLGRYARQPYGHAAADFVPATRVRWPNLPADAFKGYTQADVDLRVRLERAMGR